jgi:uncharacterized protein
MPSTWHQRVNAADWDAVAADMNDVGGALLPQLITATECVAVRDLYPDDGLFRATVDMTRHRTGTANTATSNSPTHTRSRH